MLGWVWEKVYLHSLMMELQNGAFFMESSVEKSQKNPINKTNIWPKLISPCHMPKGLHILLHRCFLSHLHCCSIHRSQAMEQRKNLSTEEEIMKIWPSYTMEYYSAVKKN